jgi:hypothetical protein
MVSRMLWAMLLTGGILAVAAGETRPFAQTVKNPAEPDYNAAVWAKLHFLPAVNKVTDAQCLACHQEILERKPRPLSPNGVKADDVVAWYQILDTYAGGQETFHWRHIQSPFAKNVMKLSCNFCHRGHDPREEAPGASATGSAQDGKSSFALRKVVDPKATCLRCHGTFPHEIMGLPGPWHEVRADMEIDGVKNGCLEACHEEAFRTNRHNVTYLNAAKIEELAKESSDTCLGCHGGRSWYRISYPYPRNSWPDMDEEAPDWAKDRPTQSEARYRIPSAATDADKNEN